MRVTGQAQRQRRRGEELEAALLDAAWEELLEAGFAKLTMESVAARAKTGVAVLYRRWPGKDDLAMAAIAHYARAHPVAMPDTGSLRGDMLALLASFNDTRNSFTVVTTATFAGLQASSGLTPGEVRARILGNRTQPAQIFLHAHERGEIDLDKTPPAVLTMPFDLMRHDLLMTLKPVSSDRIATIVDDLFMPLVAAYRPAAGLPVAPWSRRRDGDRGATDPLDGGRCGRAPTVWSMRPKRLTPWKLTCESAASCGFTRRFRRSSLHDAVNPHVVLAQAGVCGGRA
jgi:AcrR family transcriptional regulator